MSKRERRNQRTKAAILKQAGFAEVKTEAKPELPQVPSTPVIELEEITDDPSKLQAWERIDATRDATGLPGYWKEIPLTCPNCDNDKYVYIYDDNNTIYCLNCDQEFEVKEVFDGDIDYNTEYLDMVSDDPEKVNDAIKRMERSTDTPIGFKNDIPAIPYKQYGASPEAKGFDWNKFCTHSPQHIIDGETWGVWAGKKFDVTDCAKQFDVVLNLTFNSIKYPHIIPIPELKKWETPDEPFIEIQLDWPDYDTVNLPREFWVDLLAYLETNNYRMLVFCMGGHGRTGTAIATMMCLSLGYTAKQAITWVREHYCTHAIETITQERYVETMAKETKALTAEVSEG